MVIRSTTARRCQGALTTDLLVAISILLLTIGPVLVSFLSEQRLARAYYHRAVAMEIVDGELEVLAAGGWRAFTVGSHLYRPRAETVSSLPPGRFLLTLAEDRVRLEWIPEQRRRGGLVVREARLER